MREHGHFTDTLHQNAAKAPEENFGGLLFCISYLVWAVGIEQQFKSTRPMLSRRCSRPFPTIGTNGTKRLSGRERSFDNEREFGADAAMPPTSLPASCVSSRSRGDTDRLAFGKAVPSLPLVL